MFWSRKWNFFHISKSFAMWHGSCCHAFNRMKLDRRMKRKMPVGIRDSKQIRMSMFLFARRRRRRSRYENDSFCSWCSRKWSLVSHDSNFFALFFSLRFLNYLGGWHRLIRLEGIFGVLWDKKNPEHHIHLSLCKGLCPIYIEFSPCLLCPNSV